MKIAVVSAHRGDAALSVGLAIEAWLVHGHAVEVVSCFTRSEFAPYSDANSVHANDRVSFVTAVRKREDETWRKLYGAAKLTLTELNLKDAPLRLHCPPEEVLGRGVDLSEKVVAKVRRAIELSKAEAVVLPLALSGHVDRVIARDVSLMTASRLPLAFYEELPDAASGAAGKAVQSAVDQLSLMLQTELQPIFAGEPAGSESATDAAVLRKRRMAWCYDSQIDESLTATIAEFCRSHEGRERLWANAAWRSNAALSVR